MTTQFKIIEKKNLWFTISLTLILFGLGLMTLRTINSEAILNFGIDFKGGSNLMLKFDSLTQLHAENKTLPAKETNLQFIEQLRSHLKKDKLEKSAIQITNEQEVIIKTNLLTNKKSQTLLNKLRDSFGTIEILEIDFIGPSIGAELRQKSLWITFIVSIALLLYITWRFEFVFGIAALIALLHDALITISYAAFTGLEINTAFVAAILTVLGYSINDTIVVFDRIRENIKNNPKETNIQKLANLSLNQTIARTINTTITTLMVITALLVFGGTTIKPFCTVLLVGILAGTYSSVFIASQFLVSLYKKEVQ